MRARLRIGRWLLERTSNEDRRLKPALLAVLLLAPLAALHDPGVAFFLLWPWVSFQFCARTPSADKHVREVCAT